MRKFYIVAMALFLSAAFMSTAHADKAVKAAEAKFRIARKAYIAASKELGDAKLDSLFTMGKEEKQKAVNRIRDSREETRATKKVYKKTLKALHNAEMARDAKIDRSPWK